MQRIVTHGDRLHSLDAVRAFALLAGVVLHATMSFLPGFAAAGWPIADNSPSVTLGLTFYVIHIFRMTLFFLIAGFFGRLMLQRDGGGGFVRNRAKRILMPLVVGWIVVMPLLVAALAWGASKSGGGAAALPPRPDDPFWFPLTHLWFLYVLLWMYGATLFVRWALARTPGEGAGLRVRIDSAIAAVVRAPLAPVLLGAPLWVTLITRPEWMAWFGVPTPDQSLIPNLPAATVFGTAFGLGWLLHRQPALLRVWEARWAVHALGATALTAACLTLVGMSPVFVPVADGWRTWLYTACYTSAVWLWTFAFVGVGLRFFSDVSPVRRYVADASYWIYLAHLPVVFFLQVAVQDAPLHWTIKFPFILIAAFGLLFVSYHYLVRPTWVGAVLNGRRYPRRTTPEPRLSHTV